MSGHRYLIVTVIGTISPIFDEYAIGWQRVTKLV
ncbi:hypothetical protein VIRA109638_15105 [Vibrio rarus]